MRLRPAIVLASAAALAGIPALNACTACFGKTDEALAQGMNAGIYVMLVFVVAAWVLFGSFFVFIARRSQRVHADADSGDASPTTTPNPEPPTQAPRVQPGSTDFEQRPGPQS